MVQLNQTIISLNNFLTTSGYYLIDEDTGTSEKIFSEWNDRLLSALQEYFANHAQANLSFTDAYFELFEDHGATVWGVKSMTEASESEHGFSFLVECISGYQKVKAYLTEEGL